MNPAKTAPAEMYCLGCYYNLHGLASHRCPECGRTFDPNKPRTFSRKSEPTPVRDFMSRVGKAVENALTVDDPDQALRRLRGYQSSLASEALWLRSEVAWLRKMNNVLRIHLDLVLDVMIEHGLLDPAELEALKPVIELACADPEELVETLEEEPPDAPTPELLELQQAAEESAKTKSTHPAARH